MKALCSETGGPTGRLVNTRLGELSQSGGGFHHLCHAEGLVLMLIVNMFDVYCVIVELSPTKKRNAFTNCREKPT